MARRFSRRSLLAATALVGGAVALASWAAVRTHAPDLERDVIGRTLRQAAPDAPITPEVIRAFHAGGWPAFANQWGRAATALWISSRFVSDGNGDEDGSRNQLMSRDLVTRFLMGSNFFLRDNSTTPITWLGLNFCPNPFRRW